MDVKKIFGTLLTLCGAIALLYAAYLFINTSGGTRNMKVLGTAAVLGAVFFVAGIGLVRTVKDEVAP